MALLIRQYKLKCTQLLPVITNLCRFTNGKTMPVTEEQIRNKLQNELSATHVEVIDHSGGCGANFSCLVVSEKFNGKPILHRHRLVNNILKEELQNIHAFSQTTLTPEQWNSQQAANNKQSSK